jgi:F-type H+/Na+-transporting ATPase subunit beta
VATAFTGLDGKYVPVEETVRSFREIIDGKHDDVPERAFLMKGTIDEVVEATRGAEEEEEQAEQEGEEPESGESQEGEPQNGDSAEGNGEE